MNQAAVVCMAFMYLYFVSPLLKNMHTHNKKQKKRRLMRSTVHNVTAQGAAVQPSMAAIRKLIRMSQPYRLDECGRCLLISSEEVFRSESLVGKM